jgi:hypothetical protein
MKVCTRFPNGHPGFFPATAVFIAYNLVVPTKNPVRVDFLDFSDPWQVALPV